MIEEMNGVDPIVWQSEEYLSGQKPIRESTFKEYLAFTGTHQLVPPADQEQKEGKGSTSTTAMLKVSPENSKVASPQKKVGKQKSSESTPEKPKINEN